MTKHGVSIAHLKLNDSQDVELRYYVLEEKRFNEDFGKEYISFGIEVEKEECNVVETCKVPDITCDKEKIYSIANMITRNEVFPVHLNDVILDMME